MARSRPPRALSLLSAVLLAACDRGRQPAQELLTRIATAAAAAAADANRYLPDRQRHVDSELGDLEIAFARGQFAEVSARGPAVLGEARALAAAASAAKTARRLELTARWNTLSAALPGDIDSISARIDRRRAGTETLRTSLSGVTSLWSKAQAAFATGNLEEAVSTAVRVDGEARALAAAVNCPRPECLR